MPKHPRWLAITVFVLWAGVQAGAWHNGLKSATPNDPKFGGHDYIAYQAYVRAGKPAWITANLNVYLTGTAAPDTAVTKPAGTVGRYQDTSPCHCILFDARGRVVDDRMAVRATEEFMKANDALTRGNTQLAAFYAGAMAHYIGDLSQFCHLMDRRSHWGAEDQKLHAAYEDAVDKTFDPVSRRSTLLDPFLHRVAVTGTSPRAIALAVARFTEKGIGGHDPGWMNTQMTTYASRGLLRRSERWSADFTSQTGENVNYAVNGVTKLLGMFGEDD